MCGKLDNFGRLVQIVFFVGSMVGVFLIGPFSDTFGRKFAYMTSLTVWFIFSIIGYFVDNPYVWIVTRFIVGGASLAYNTASAIYT